ncbi:class I SAM-dependent methyltransferase [Virgibacillus sp. DJP39]|uniref:class I SAM-dependent methyltransferase n=1 Tax=Virgibacillus sp. DJP39 TaxID=3409790 RepID=UPI003BB51A37
MKNLFDNVAKDFTKYRSGYPNKFYKKLEQDYNICLQDQKVLDIATSNGLAARDLARRGCFVTGIDNSPELINEAKNTYSESLNIDYILGDVTKLPFGNELFDVVTAVHCWEVLPKKEASKEALRVLKNSGKFVVSQFDQLPIGNNIVSQTEKLVSKYNTEWNSQNSYGFYPQWIEEIYEVGFSNIETFTFDVTTTYTHDEWKGRMRTGADIGGSLSRDDVLLFNKELDNLLKSNYSGELLEVPQRMFSIVCEKKIRV